MSAATLLKTLRAQGWRFAVDGDQVRIRRPKGALTEALHQALTAEKPAIIQILVAEQQRALAPPQADEIAAVKVWSEVLQEAVWVVADGVPLDPYLREGKVFTHAEVRVLLAHGRGIKGWAPLDGEISA